MNKIIVLTDGFGAVCPERDHYTRSWRSGHSSILVERLLVDVSRCRCIHKMYSISEKSIVSISNYLVLIYKPYR